VRAASLLAGKTKSCGHCRDESRDRLLTLYWLEKQLGREAFDGLKHARQTAHINYIMAHALGREPVAHDSADLPPVPLATAAYEKVTDR
jgi:hypothetical protein